MKCTGLKMVVILLILMAVNGFCMFAIYYAAQRIPPISLEKIGIVTFGASAIEFALTGIVWYRID
jgi:uncharacterized paraquat-inducible protein A